MFMDSTCVSIHLWPTFACGQLSFSVCEAQRCSVGCSYKIGAEDLNRGWTQAGVPGTPDGTLGGWSTWVCSPDAGVEKPVLVLTACHERSLRGWGACSPRSDVALLSQRTDFLFAPEHGSQGERVSAHRCVLARPVLIPRSGLWIVLWPLTFLFWRFFQDTEKKSLCPFSKKRTIWEKTDRLTLGFYCSGSWSHCPPGV